MSFIVRIRTIDVAYSANYIISMLLQSVLRGVKCGMYSTLRSLCTYILYGVTFLSFLLCCICISIGYVFSIVSTDFYILYVLV